MKRIPEAEAAVVFVDRTGEITRVGFLGGAPEVVDLGVGVPQGAILGPSILSMMGNPMVV